MLAPEVNKKQTGPAPRLRDTDFIQNSRVISVLQYPSSCTELSMPFLWFSELSVK